MKLLERVVFEACDSVCYDLVFVVELDEPTLRLPTGKDTLAIHRTTSQCPRTSTLCLRPSSDIFIRLEAQNRGL
jgi:hypothetical protein